MRSTFILAALSGLVAVNAQSSTTPVTGKLGDAQPVNDNPVGPVYKATLPDSKTSNIRGSVTARAGPGGKGIKFEVQFSGLPNATLGPFIYHIHEQPVPANGNCTATLAHLDPYQRGEDPPCDASKPATCQVGDLAGKWGNITSNPFSATYTDPFVSDSPGNKASLVGKSIVIHTNNKTRLTCANFKLDNSTANGTSTTGAGGSVPTGPSSTTSSKPAGFTGGATANVVGFGAVAAGLIGAVAFFL